MGDGIFQVDIGTVLDSMRKCANLAKSIILEAIPRIAAMNWDPICDQYKVWITSDSKLIYYPICSFNTWFIWHLSSLDLEFRFAL